MNTSRCIALAALLPACAVARLPQDKKVTYAAPAAQASKLLPALGAAAGVQMKAAPTTAHDILLISVKDVSLDALMQKIAETENASWQKEGDVFVLNRDARQRQGDESTEVAALATRYRESLLKISGEAAALKAVDDSFAKGLVKRAESASTQSQNGNNWTQVQQVSAEGPTARLLTRLIATLKAEDLAAIPDDGRAVFSDNPNRMQRRFTSSISSAVQQYLKEQAILANAASLASAEEHNPYMQLGAILHPNTMQPAKILLIATRPPLQGQINCNLEVLDAKGNVISQAEKTVGSNPFESMDPFKPTKPQNGEAKFVLSEESKNLRAHMRIMEGRGGPVPELTDALKKKISDPVANEPLSFATTEVLTQYASRQNANLVAALSDMTVVFAVPFSGDDILPSQIPALLRLAEEHIEAKDGWLTIVPNLPAEARKTQADRVALRTLMQSLLQKGSLSLDDAAAYALSSTSVQFDPMGILWSAALSQTAMQTFEQNGMPLLRFYGGLSPSQRQGAKANAAIPFSALVGTQRDALFEMVFGSQSRLGASSTMAIEEGSQPIFPTNEPTERLPNGLTNDGRFTLKLQTESVVSPGQSEGVSRMFDMGMSATDLAWRVFAQDHPDIGGSWAQEPQNRVSLDSLVLNSRTTYSFHFDLAPTVTLDEQLREMKGGGKKVTFNDLPADFKDAYLKMTDQYKTMKWGPGQWPVTPPPPPR